MRLLILSLIFLLAPLAQSEPFRIAFGACLQNGDPGVLDEIGKKKPHLFIFLGDNVDAQNNNLSSLQQSYALLAGSESFQRLSRTVPLVATWDDHDYGLNDGGADFPLKNQSRAEFLKFWRIPPSDERWHRGGIYSSLVPKAGVQVILLDTRFFRSPLKRANSKGAPTYLPDDNPGLTMLGEDQWKWLETELKKPSHVKIIVSSIQVIPDEHVWEKWSNLPRERQRLLSLIKGANAGKKIIISGDRHSGELSKLEDPVLFELTSSSLTRSRRFRKEPNRFRVGPQFFDPNFGLITLELGDRPLATVELYSAQGERVVGTGF